MVLGTSLGESSLGQGLEADQLQVLASRAELRRYAVGERVLSRDDTAFPLIVLLEGEAEVRGMFGQNVSRLKAGALVGEIAFVDRGSRTADVIAVTPVQAAFFDHDLADWLDREHPAIAAQMFLNLSRVLCSKLRWAQRLIDAGDAAASWPDR